MWAAPALPSPSSSRSSTRCTGPAPSTSCLARHKVTQQHHNKDLISNLHQHACGSTHFCVFVAAEHRNMPMQDAMMLVAHNYDSYKVENREKEREEIARKGRQDGRRCITQGAGQREPPPSLCSLASHCCLKTGISFITLEGHVHKETFVETGALGNRT